MIDEARLRVEGRVVGVRPVVGFRKVLQRGEVRLARDTLLERGEEGEVAFGGRRGAVETGDREDTGRGAVLDPCRLARTDFREGIDQRRRQVAVLRVDTGEPVSIAMPCLVARPVERQFEFEAQPLSLAR